MEAETNNVHSITSNDSPITMFRPRVIEKGRASIMHPEKRNADRVLVGKPEGKRPLGRPRRK
jgi:hypothetical protein